MLTGARICVRVAYDEVQFVYGQAREEVHHSTVGMGSIGISSSGTMPEGSSL